jgi:prevent-host-death family protein
MAIMATSEESMKTVNIAQLKNNLSVYLNHVRRGGQVLIKDRNLPVAKIVQLDAEDEEALALAAEGRIKLPEKPGGIPDSFFSLPGASVSLNKILRALRKERDEAR